ncbi:hypothetical protein [Marininema halotolerans]|nr:hypothetical protein [Marininema halotolerans]
MDKKDRWTRYFITFSVDAKRKVQAMDYRYLVSDCEGSVHVTDLMLQIGGAPAGYIPANQELLKRDRDQEDHPITRRHFNGVIRGEKTIAVPNREKVDQEKDLSKRVTGGIDFYLTPTQATSSDGVHFAHQYGQRVMAIHPALVANSELECSASKRQVTIDGAFTSQYSGKFHTCPAGFGIYHLTLLNNQGKQHGSGKLRCEVDMWLKGMGGERM